MLKLTLMALLKPLSLRMAIISRLPNVEVSDPVIDI